MTRPLVVFCILITSCNSRAVRTDESESPFSVSKDSVENNSSNHGKPNDVDVSKHHLRDTLTITGDFVLFLRPDSIRFEEYAREDEYIYEADSDFGFAISATTKGMATSNKYSNIRTGVFDRRYILIRDCKNGPLIIDRDTINYGVILTSNGSTPRTQTLLHSGDYLQDVDEYFKIHREALAGIK